MLVRVVQLEILPEQTARFLELYGAHQEVIRKNPGCRYLALLQEEKFPNRVATLSHWSSEEDLNHYRNSEFFRNLWSTVKPLFAAPAKAFSYRILENGTTAI